MADADLPVVECAGCGTDLYPLEAPDGDLHCRQCERGVDAADWPREGELTSQQIEARDQAELQRQGQWVGGGAR